MAKAPSVLLLLVAAACQTPAGGVFSSLETSSELLSTNPADIAVLPVEDATADGSARVVTDALREEIARALVQRYYAPLAPAMVDDVLAGELAAPAAVSVLDASWLESVGGRFGEDAVLAVRITRWDASSLMATGVVRFAAELTMKAPAQPEALWSGGVHGEVKAGGSGPAPRDRTGRLRAAATEVAGELIRRLPRRHR